MRSNDNRMKPLPRIEFKGAQSALMQRGTPEQGCGACGCRREHHLPPPTFSYAKSGGSSGGSVELPCIAPTSCSCPYCLCCCTHFVEPFEGQPFLKCTYEPAPKPSASAFTEKVKAEMPSPPPPLLSGEAEPERRVVRRRAVQA